MGPFHAKTTVNRGIVLCEFDIGSLVQTKVSRYNLHICSTVPFFFKDKLVKLIVVLIINPPFTAAWIWVATVGEQYVFFYLWILFSIVLLAGMTIYPEYIAPLFDKYTPFPRSELKEKIDALAQRVEFPLEKLYVLENSKRSSHSNAYMYGFWKNKGIVLYDTMLSQRLMDQLNEVTNVEESKNDQNQGSIGENDKVIETKSEEPNNENTKKCLGMSDDEVVAILAHELGHWKLWHSIKHLVMINLLFMFPQLAAFAYFYRQESLYGAFGFSSRPFTIGFIIVFQFITGIYGKFVTLPMYFISRRAEFSADRFAAKLGYADHLSSALIKMGKNNLSLPVDDHLYSMIHHSHPSVPERVAALKNLQKAKRSSKRQHTQGTLPPQPAPLPTCQSREVLICTSLLSPIPIAKKAPSPISSERKEMKTMPMWLAAACLCAALLVVDGSRLNHRVRSTHESSSQESEDDSQGINSFKDLFQPGTEYCFDYNAQIASGYSPRISSQQAMSRLNSEVCLLVNQENVGTFRMRKIKTGQRNEAYGPAYEGNGDSGSYASMQPMETFNKPEEREKEMLNAKLVLPVEFLYNDGLVTSIQFHQDDEPWSKNLKKAVLNLIQLNASPANTHLRNPEEHDERKSKQNRAFTTMEANIEGVCQTSYTVTSLKSERDPRKSSVNVTKSIDFLRCEALADVAYGFQIEPKPAKVFPDKPMYSSRQEQSQPSHSGTAIPKEKLGRSTIVRYVLSKNAQKKSQQNGNTYGIRRVELISEYVVKSSEAESNQAMQTVAIAELVFQKTSEPSVNREPTNIDASQSRAESLLYNSYVESGEKEFFMKGDQTDVDVFRFSKKDSQAQVEEAVSSLESLVNVFTKDNKKYGHIDSTQSAELLERLVKVMRVCSMEELRQIESKTQERLAQGKSEAEFAVEQKQQIAADLFADALAVAATRNTISMMTEKIQKSEQGDQENGKAISETKAVQLLAVLGRGAGLPAPSDAQVDSILSLCKSEKVQNSENGLKQVCWLTFGTMVGELTLQSSKAKSLGITKTPMKKTEICPETKIDLYRDVLVEQLNAAETMYDKILALKCLGNAGLVTAIPALRKVFTDKTESPIVRINAMDAMRRLKFTLPAEAIQSQLLPLYANTEEDSEVRMKALGMIMRTRPSKAIIDQIAMVMANEKSIEVQSMAYSHIKTISESPVPEDKKCRRSRYTVYNHQQQEGVFVDWTQVFSDSDSSDLPSHIHLGMDTFFNGQFNPNSAKLSVCQKDIEKIAKQIFSGKSSSDLDDPEEGDDEEDKKDDEPGFFSKAVDSLKGIFGKANIKGRDQSKKHQHARKTGPYVIATFRLNNVDLAMAPLVSNSKSKAGTASQIARKAKQALANLLQRFGAGSEKMHMQLNAAMVVNSRMSSVPTSVGVGLRMSQSMYLIGQVKASGQIYAGGKVDAKLHPNFNWVQTQKMEALTSSYSSGVSSSRMIEINLPLEATVQQTKNSKSGSARNLAQEYKISVKVPEKQTTVFGMHSLATTFTRGENISIQMNNGNDKSYYHDQVKTVYSQLLRHQEREVNFTAGEQNFLGVPVRVSGHFQQPRQFDSLQEIMKVIMSGDNNLHVEFHPEDTNRKELQVVLGWNLFQDTSKTPAASIRPRIQDFYSGRAQDGATSSNGQQRQQDYVQDESDESDSLEDEQERIRNSATKKEKQFDQHLGKKGTSSKGNKKHTINVQVETIGSGRQNEASATLETVCDYQVRACESTLRAKRSALAHERGDWSLQAQSQTLYPDYVYDIDELIEATEGEKKRQQKFFSHIEAEWGSQNQPQESIKLNAEGEASQEMMKQILNRVRQQYSQYQEDSFNDQPVHPSSRRCNSGRGCWNRKQPAIASPRNTPFLNKYTMVAEYSLKPSTEFVFQRGMEMVKNYYFWNTRSKILNSRGQQNVQGQNERGLARSGAQRSEQVNQGQLSALLSIDPITQQHANVTILTPGHQIKIRNMELPMRMHPMKLVRPYNQPALIGTSQKRAQCKVGSKTVDTFDNVALKAPSSTCYTVLAKDCSHQEKPKFAVLMKSVSNDSEEKKIKIITRRTIVEIESKGENQMRLVINDRAFKVENGHVAHQSDEQYLRENGIEVETDNHDRQAVIVDFGKLSIKFNGLTAKIQLSGEYKNMQCGLCGNFNDNPEDELRKADNEPAEDVQSFHKSYTIQDEECAPQEHQRFYDSANNHKFGDDTDNQQNEVEPTSQTMIKEATNKLCFSQKPVKQCPRGWFPADEDESDTQLLKRKKVGFSCFERSSHEAKRLKSEVRRLGTADITDYPPSFEEEVVIPVRCVAY
ncbi:lipoprotein amino terminal region domain-containing protein [Ditylenchus destructor]|nr:lipoprotein amino terminal region domain-containing protein [Ditylenchus destructor]